MFRTAVYRPLMITLVLGAPLAAANPEVLDSDALSLIHI